MKKLLTLIAGAILLAAPALAIQPKSNSVNAETSATSESAFAAAKKSTVVCTYTAQGRTVSCYSNGTTSDRNGFNRWKRLAHNPRNGIIIWGSSFDGRMLIYKGGLYQLGSTGIFYSNTGVIESEGSQIKAKPGCSLYEGRATLKWK